MRLATECLRLCIAADGNHAPAYNNLGVLEMRRGRTAHARAFFQTAAQLAGYLFEPSFNHALLAYEVSNWFLEEIFLELYFQCGDLQTSFVVVQKALEAYPTHVNSLNLLKDLRKHFNTI